jgi:hypothetical protein
MEAALAEWFLANQEHVNLSGDLIRESAMKIIDRLYPDHPPFEFSNGFQMAGLKLSRSVTGSKNIAGSRKAVQST